MRLFLLKEKPQRDLFETLVRDAVGHAIQDIAGAAINLLITAVQRGELTQGAAEARYDDLVGQGKELLKLRYREGFKAVG